MPLERFDGKTAVITGGASGIGLAMARRFGAAGANVVVADVQLDALRRAEAELKAAGVNAMGLTCDVAHPEQLDSLALAVQQTFGEIHLVCNNAGVYASGRLEEIPLETWHWVVDVNLWGVVHGCRSFVPILRRQGVPAHIVNTASMAGLGSGPDMAPYFVSKFGVVALSEALWYELQADDSPVGVSVLCPGPVDTAILDAERNKPVHVPEVRTGDHGERFTQMMRGLLSEGLSPGQVAELVAQGVVEDRFWLLPHAEAGSHEAVRARADAIVDGASPHDRWRHRHERWRHHHDG